MYSIIDEHADFLVLSKHQGVCIHSAADQIGLMVQLKKDLGSDNVFPVHRLDKVTSGLLLCAKTAAAASELSQLFQHRKVEKFYLAISDQKPKKKQGLISGDMQRSRRSSWKLCKTKSNPAITQFFSYSIGAGQRLYLLKPKTGKTHQLRVALKSIAAPIMGDRLYGHPLEMPLGIYLHAFVLSFTYQGKVYRYMNQPEHWLLDSKGLGEKARIDICQPWNLAWPVISA
ncbi:MAG: tRNA pseudouridine32 synthase/23S rRNA pseudouridine746 synthase [Candidatus Endobugula sp.]|jgi:tRNA pseudouridine32 synthase/23S rRNA pseudouridine746 synthase